VNALPDINKQFVDWYQEVIFQAELVDHVPVRGCMVVRPYGTALWENIVAVVDKKIKATGHSNALFPLLIPLSFIQKEAKHVEGFAPELAIVTKAGGKDLEEPYVVRPTSETIIHHMFARWIKSYRDLPLKINQWASVMRWEMRPRAFLRTTEFYWQEGHTAHATLEEAEAEVALMLNEYIDLAENYLAIPVFGKEKPASERFAGAERTFTIEGLMPDGKALQMGTSHLLSQSFAHAFDMKFQNKEGSISYPWLTSWAVTTRLIGALVMTHGDQKGLVLPPRIAPIQVVILPIFRKGADNEQLRAACATFAAQLKQQGISVLVDDNEHDSAGAKFYRWELKGVPVRIELGPRDLEQRQAVIVDRLTLTKKPVALDVVVTETVRALEDMQSAMLERARQRRDGLVSSKNLALIWQKVVLLMSLDGVSNMSVNNS
jgi:prolyl-tRNA synthetase